MNDKIFNVVENGLVNNALLQFIPIVAINLAMFLTINDEIINGLSFIGLILSTSVNILLVVSYENNPFFKGDYFYFARKYNFFAGISTLTTGICLFWYMCCYLPLSSFRLASAGFSLCCILYFLYSIQ